MSEVENRKTHKGKNWFFTEILKLTNLHLDGPRKKKKRGKTQIIKSWNDKGAIATSLKEKDYNLNIMNNRIPTN